MKNILTNNKENLALIIGNGVNKYDNEEKKNSWKDLLIEVAKSYIPGDWDRFLSRIGISPEGDDFPGDMSLTEFYNLIELRSKEKIGKSELQEKFCSLMEYWEPQDQHERIVEWCKNNKTPILTTNFEHTLEEAGGCELRRNNKKGFTDFYPWETCFSTGRVKNPSREFAIWHINGMAKYKRSIRLGLTHYMGSVQRARKWIHSEEDGRLFSEKNTQRWRGVNSWLHTIFNNDILIFGIRLDKDEVFLRWLLIERARYFRKFPESSRDGWFISNSISSKEAKKYFLRSVGINPIDVESYDKIYGREIW